MTDEYCRLSDRSVQVLQHLARRGSAWPEASAAAIRDLRSRMSRTLDKTLANAYGNDPGREERPARVQSTTTEQAITTSQDTQDQASNPGYGLFDIDSSANSNHPHSGQSQAPHYTAFRTQDFTADENNIQLNDILSGGLAAGQPSDQRAFDALDPFSGFDIPFWFEQDQNWNIFQDFD